MNSSTPQHRKTKLAELSTLVEDVRVEPVADTESGSSRGALERQGQQLLRTRSPGPHSIG